MDFTIKIYKSLLNSLIHQGYHFRTFEEFLKFPEERVIILRHDVDLLPRNSLKFAEIQSELGLKAVYYFRATKKSWNEQIIVKIAELGHEIGYHYECLSTCNGNMDKAIEDFKYNLAQLRKIVTVSTICMHGSPMSKFDSKDLWLKYNYVDFEIIGEPYFNIDFNKVLYLTDTGRRWDGQQMSVRDKVKSSFPQAFHSTKEIIEAAYNNTLPSQIMFTFHPQRWSNNLLNWIKELLLQNIKNIIKMKYYTKK